MIKLLSLTASPSPGPEPLTWDRVREGVSWFFSNLSPAFVWPLFGLLIVAAFFAYYWWCLRPRPRSLEWIALAEEKSAPRRLTLTLKRHPMERRDALPLLLLTAVYALTAFFQLGDFNAPQSMVKFQQGDSHEFSYNQPVTVDTVSLYTSLGTGYYTLEWEEEDGRWYSLRPEQYYNSLFKWHILELDRNVDQNGLEITKDNDNLDAEPLGPITAARFRITASSAPRDEGLWLSELALWSGGKALPQPDHVDDGAAALFDEHELWSDRYTYMNSTYFDEIYHPRTAYEHLNNVYPYEVSHPPLGKLIISIGIAMFGMVPFGWRFMGTLFGVLMVPILYVFLKNLFGKTPVALCGTALFTFDFMHLVQTRIATIDTYGVFFILVSYYFMYRWLTVPAGKKLRHYVLPLFLSGLFWGVGCASKWTVVYAGAGLALLWLLGMIFKAGDWHEAELAAQTQPVPPEVRREVTEAMFREEQPAWTPPRVPSFTAHAWGTVGLSVVFFVVIPLMIYTASYFPYAAAKGNGGSFLELAGQSAGWFWECLPERLEQYPEQMARVTENLAREGKTPGVADRIGAFFQAIPDQSGNPVDLMLRNQYFMLTYHQSVHTPHPYQSNWYQWIIDARPILYYQDFSTPGMRGIFASFNNPLVSWAGLLAFFAVAVQMVRRKCGKALFIVLATLSQLVPWTAIGRVLFAYHYFPTVLFLCFAIAYLMDDMLNRKREGARLAVYGFTGCTGLLYAIFYPELIGISVPNWYATYFLRWFPSWPL
ncbi:MAG: phospholipid carrier-dependent glycosyltransferase [Oscillospiraceae bacterium]|jgi:dolichyl-phosphate-mannose-protein mannosyltransferase|nr:phospholipid carrier-dependent glycosyltransferase [Oscillospiraceae bacterium]